MPLAARAALWHFGGNIVAGNRAVMRPRSIHAPVQFLVSSLFSVHIQTSRYSTYLTDKAFTPDGHVYTDSYSTASHLAMRRYQKKRTWRIAWIACRILLGVARTIIPPKCHRQRAPSGHRLSLQCRLDLSADPDVQVRWVAKACGSARRHSPHYQATYSGDCPISQFRHPGNPVPQSRQVQMTYKILLQRLLLP